MTEYIARNEYDKDAWKCVCGNIPESDGFYPCDKNGRPMEPTFLYVCDRCGRIIDQEPLEVVGRKKP